MRKRFIIQGKKLDPVTKKKKARPAEGTVGKADEWCRLIENSIVDPIWGGKCDVQQGHTLQEHF